LKNRPLTKPWMLAGGLNAKNVKKAVAQSGAVIIDVSSSVETGGKKDVHKIQHLLQASHAI
ncbi:MAG: N-(5'-phosphoribosyl)anthranilate isomerase, partial [Alphaproteobacteria bacterium]|nr:N-(5'-phosphoribosyl)anthranilate isomerase [Alphaproteobacteria bacterium]